MKQLPEILLVLIFASNIGWASPANSNVDEIIDGAVAALGGYDKIHAIQSLNYSGTYLEGHYAGGAHMTRLRPNKRLVGCVPQVCDGKADSYLEIFDGERGWEVNIKRQRTVQMKRKAELAGRCGAEEFFPIFVDYKEKGHAAELQGKTVIRGTPVWAVKITPKRCQAKIFYFDRQSYLPIADRMQYNVHARGEARDQLHLMTDYREVNGVKIPFAGEEVDYRTGEHLSGSSWAKIEANTVTDESIFIPPAVRPDAGTQLVLNMLEASETEPGKDVVAMYTQWRQKKENQQVDMENNLTFLGYELLKADRYDSAIPLMEALVREYPTHAGNYDSLGTPTCKKATTRKRRPHSAKPWNLIPKRSTPKPSWTN